MIDIESELNLRPLAKSSVLLRPHQSSDVLGFDKSKMGGVPNLQGFQSWPTCRVCRTPMNFVMQLYQEDFEKFYFPPGKNIFQVFRCPNIDCLNNFNESYDLLTEAYYHHVSRVTNKPLEKPVIQKSDLEKEVPDCFFKPQETKDYPNYQEIPGYDEFDRKHGNTDTDNLFWAEFQPRTGTKVYGYPSWSQDPDVPRCSCGNEKDFIFQLSSEDLEDGQEWPPPSGEWSPHGIMIGDVGSLFFFVCKSCGEKTLETKWDCG